MKRLGGKRVGWFRFTAAVSLLYCLIFVTFEFFGNPIVGWKGFMVLALHWAVVALCCFGVVGVMAVSRILFAVAFPLLTVASAVLAYFKATMGMELTPMSVELMMVNDVGTWATVMSFLLVGMMAVALAAGIWAAVFRWRRVSVAHPLDFAVLSVLLVLMPFCFVTRFRAPVSARMPFVFYTAFDGYLANRININEDRNNFAHVPASSEADDVDVVLVIGESLRSDHLSFNGYPRPTAPLLSQLKADSSLVSFPAMRSIPCFTHVSVPYMLTAADSVNPGRAYEEQSAITLFRKAGYHTAWISNQDMTPSYAYFMREADTLLQCRPAKSLYDFGKWLDTDILPRFASLIGSDRGRKRLTVVHSIGSHWWYPSHYVEDERVFRPEVRSRILSEVTPEEMVNSYDNTIVATDRFLRSLVSGLEDRKAVLIYISDHGEALGEEGHWLHGEDYPQLHNPACFVWFSDRYRDSYPDKVTALRENSPAFWRSESIFHTLLDAGDIATPVMADTLSMMRPPVRRK